MSQLTLLATVAACGRTAGSNDQQLLELASKASTRLKAQNEKAADSLTNRNALTTERLLRGLIDKEREERIAADKILGERIDALKAELSAFREEVNGRFDKIDKRDAALRGELQNNFDELRKVDKDLAASIEAEAKARIAELTSVRGEITSLEGRVIEKISATEKSLSAQIEEQKNTINAALEKAKQANQAQIDKLTSSISDLGTQLESEKANGGPNVKTLEQEISKVQSQLNAERDRVSQLEKAAADEKDRLSKTIEQHDAARTAMRTELQNLQAELRDSKAVLKDQMASMNAAERIERQAQAKDLEDKLARLSDAMKAENQALADKQEKLNQRASSLESRMVAEEKARSDAMSSLEAKTKDLLSSTDATTRSELQLLINQAKDSSGKSLENLQKQMMEKLSSFDSDVRIELVKITNGMSDIRQDAKSNREDLEKKILTQSDRIQDELKQKIVSIDRAIDSARSEMDAKLARGVSGLSEELTEKIRKAESGLSETMRAEIAARRLEIEGMKGSLKQSEDNFSKQIEQAKKDNSDKLTELKSGLDSSLLDNFSKFQDETAKNQNALASLSKRLSEQQVAMAGTQASFDAKIKKLSDDSMAQEQGNAAQRQAMIDELRAQREVALAETARLQNDMTVLRAAQDSARSSLEKDMKDRLQAQGEDSKASMQAKISEVLAKLDSLDSSTSSKMSEIRNQYAQDRANSESKILSSMNEIQDKLNSAAADTKKVSERVDAVNKAQKDFEAFSSINYAAKGRLEAVELRAAGLEFVTQVMKADMASAPAEIKAMVSKEVEDRATKLDARINQVTADQDSIKNGLGSANSDFQSMMAEKYKQISDELSKVKAETRKQDDALFAALSDSTALSSKVNADLMDSVKKMSVEFETSVGKFKSSMSDKIVQLESQIGSNDSGTKQQFLEIQTKFAESVKMEQAFREQMGKDLSSVKDDLKATAASASQLIAVSNASAEDVKLLKSELRRVDNKLSVQEDAVASRFNLQSAQITDLGKSADKMKEDFNSKVSEVKGYAYDVAKGMGEEVQRDLATSSAEIAKLKAVMKAEEARLVNFYREMFGLSWDDVSDLVPDVSADQSLMLVRKDIVDGKSTVVGKGSLVRTLEAMAAVRTAFVNALQPRPKSQTGERVEAYDASFVPLMVSCGGDPEASYANALGRNSFDFLADQYVESLVNGPLGASSDSMFFKTAKMTDGASLHHYIVLSALSRFWGGSDSPACMSRIRSWASSTLASDSFKAQRDSVAKSTRLQSAVSEFVAASADLRGISNQMEQRFASRIVDGGKFIAAAMAQDPKSRARFGADKVLDQAMALLGSMSNSLNESADATYRLIEQQEKFNSIVNVQKDFAKEAVNKAADDQSARASAESAQRALNSQIATLTAKLDAFQTSYKDAAPAGVSNVDDALGKTLDVLLSVGLRAGDPALVQTSAPASTVAAPAPVLSNYIKPSISEIQHFFDDSSAKANQTDTCTGKNVVSGAGVKFWSVTSSQCWVDFKSLKTGAANTAARSIWFRVFGSASQLNVASQLCTDASSACGYAFQLNGSNIVLNPSRGTASGQVKSGTAAQGVFDLKMPDILQSKTTAVETIRFTAVGSDGSERIVSDYKVQLYSPVVLDFMPVGRPDFSRLDKSAVRFDLDGDGRAERTAWFKGYRDVGFLALDLNNNGKIDDGRELFGEAMELTGGRGKARDGYAALAQYDSNSDGFIDAQDPVFSKLLVWMDRNQDGRTNTDELLPLKSLGVTRIGLSHANLTDSERFVNGSELRTAAKFWGPTQCGTQGCNSYDVYLSTAFVVSQRK